MKKVNYINLTEREPLFKSSFPAKLPCYGYVFLYLWDAEV